MNHKPSFVLLIVSCGILLVVSGCSLLNTSPQSLFVASTTEGVAPLLVEFDALMSNDVDSDIVMYAWNFGDGTTSIKSASETDAAVASHTYQLAGTYTVTLVVTDEEGASSKVSIQIQVLAPPIPSHTNQSPNASFSASPTSGQAPLAVSFDASESSDTDGTITSYSWSFGDGESATGTTANHTYTSEGTYTAQLTVTDDDGNQDTTSRAVQALSSSSGVINVPTASFTASPVSGQAPLVVSFDASESSDSDGSIVSYTWEFDDGAVAFGVTATHTYQTPGSYTALLTVMDNDFATGAATIDIEVSEPAPNTSPTASFTVSPTSGQAPLVVSFDATVSSDSDGTIVSYSWDFGAVPADITGDTPWSCQNVDSVPGVTESHTFTVVGSYTVTLTVQDNEGATDVTTHEIEVTAAPLGPEDLYVDATSGDDETGDGSQASPYRTISKASSHTSEAQFHTVHVAAGVYNVLLGESFPIQLTNCSLIGEGDFPADVKIAGSISILEGLLIQNLTPYDYITIEIGLGKITTISRIEGTTLSRVDIYGEGHKIVTDCQFEAPVVTYDGTLDVRNCVFLEEAELVVDTDGATFVGSNTFDNLGSGSSFSIGCGITIKDSQGCRIEGNSFVGKSVTVGESASMTIAGNTFTDSYCAIRANGTVVIQGNAFAGCNNGVEVSFHAVVDLGGGPLNGTGLNDFRGVTRRAIEDERLPFSGPVYAMYNTWDTPEPLGTLAGPIDTNLFIIKWEGNSIVFSN